ncbi:hypothetical protein CDD83_2019 [Cordyceps sp. RAO-2017]|nr:hypothetical protein CDD83_2019 [Cordyceps sp. RAO-2017]
MSKIQHQGRLPKTSGVQDIDGYKVFRNVLDPEFGAKGDGQTDDTEAINKAISSGNRCGQGCNSSTTTPALVYLPPGEYLVSSTIIQYFYTQIVGDARNPPVIKVSPNFNMSRPMVIDAAPYDGPNTWWRSRDNFFRGISNLRFDLTPVKGQNLTCLHWPVAQATSLQNIEVKMRPLKEEEANAGQDGMLIENGSGGFMADLSFSGGKFGINVGSQQFTSRNLTFDGCRTAINMNWNWLWTFRDVSIKNCEIGIDMTGVDWEAKTPSVGSVILVDSDISATKTGVLTNYDPSKPFTNGTLVLDNVDMSKGVEAAVQVKDGETLLKGGTLIGSWMQGRQYTDASGSLIRDVREGRTADERPAVLRMDGSNKFFSRSTPQYLDADPSKIISVKSKGATGDGVTDDTKALQNIFSSLADDQIVYFDHGAYLISDTVVIPANARIVGEIWPLIRVGGEAFQNADDPRPALQVGERPKEGQPAAKGNVEIQNIMIETLGPQPGAILLEFNVEGASKGSAALFDVHFRVGGAQGTQLQLDKCRKNPDGKIGEECVGAFMLMHITESASVYMENMWLWTADHEFDLYDRAADPDDVQITIYTGRGILIESKKGCWLSSTASEHNVFYNYQLNRAENIFMGLIQSETPYFQGNPPAPEPFKVNSKYGDPDFSNCDRGSGDNKCLRSWGLRVLNSSNIAVYGTGLYSFFDNYAKETCVRTNDCQEHMIAIDQSDVRFYGVSTKASINMITLDGKPAALDADNRNTFCATLASFDTSPKGAIPPSIPSL